MFAEYADSLESILIISEEPFFTFWGEVHFFHSLAHDRFVWSKMASKTQSMNLYTAKADTRIIMKAQ